MIWLETIVASSYRNGSRAPGSRQVDLDDLGFYLSFAAVQWCIVFVRTGLRAVHFGAEQMPGDVDEFIRHRPAVEQLLADLKI